VARRRLIRDWRWASICAGASILALPSMPWAWPFAWLAMYGIPMLAARRLVNKQLAKDSEPL